MAQQPAPGQCPGAVNTQPHRNWDLQVCRRNDDRRSGGALTHRSPSPIKLQHPRQPGRTCQTQCPTRETDSHGQAVCGSYAMCPTRPVHDTERTRGSQGRPGRGVSRWSGSQNTEGGADGQTVLRVPAPSGHGGSGERAGVVGQ